MKEKDYYADASKYYTPVAIAAGRSMAIELKITKTNSIPFDCLPAHQEEKLLESERAFAHKIPDVGILKKPYDIILVCAALSLVVIVFYKPRKEEVYEITIRDFIRERETSDRKSLTIEKAREIGKRIYI